MSGLILYRTPDGQAEFNLRVLDGSVWLTQAEIAELFQISPQAVTQHIRAIYAETELEPDATCKEDLQVRSEGARQVKRKLLTYRLEIILAVGYRVRSPRGTQFRQWATRHLAEYLVKGFVMDDERLKNPGGWDYFEEFLRSRLVGRRFDKHTLPLDILKDFSAPEEILIEYSNPRTEHCSVDFTAFDKKAIEKKSKLLRAQAETRGWLFREKMA